MDQMLLNEFMMNNRLPSTIYEDSLPKSETGQTKRNNMSKKSNFCTEHFYTSFGDHTRGRSIEIKKDINTPVYSLVKKDVKQKVCQSTYNTSQIIFNNDDVTTLGVINCNDILKRTNKFMETNDYYTSNSSFTDCSSIDPESPEDFSDNISCHINEQLDSVRYSEEEAVIEDSKKGKISRMQRLALDSIFTIVDRPSRGLVLHIASQLNLHHITVKNFFSNGRRRLRRAAARINDPERTKRENQRRKEKRRMAAIATSAFRDNNNIATNTQSLLGGSNHQKELFTLSPQRKVLMEKLAVKIQKSVSQKATIHTLKKESDQFKLQKNVNAQDGLSITSTDLFSVNEHSTDKPFHLLTSSQHKVSSKNKINEMYQKYSSNEMQCGFYTSSIYEDNFYSNNFIADVDAEEMSMKHEECCSPTNWKSLIY